MSATPSHALGAYRSFARVLQAVVLPFVVSRDRRAGVPDFKEVAFDSTKKRIWFHAASVGELEVIWPVAELAAAQGFAIVLTVFSESGARAVAQLAQALSRISPCSMVLAGYSPWEGDWGTALTALGPSVFVTAKYEAWPELWASLGALEIPLLMLSARKRRSLESVWRICRLLGFRPPVLELLAISDVEGAELREWGGAENLGAAVTVIGDPRWDRVLARARGGHSRVKELVSRAMRLGAPRPWFVLGSAWPEDLDVLERGFGEFHGTVWVVPHSTAPENLSVFEAELKRMGREVLRASSHEDPRKPVRAILVDEHGILSELYGEADWAYVGGGFRKAGLHSVAEPAVHGIPILAGASKSESMSEVAELLGTGQLEFASGAEDALGWMAKQGLCSEAERARLNQKWRGQAEARAGASLRGMDRILSLLKPDR